MDTVDELQAVYAEDFLPVNADFKGLITDWQLKEPDPTRLDSLRVRLASVLDRLVEIEPALAEYRERFLSAMFKVLAGEQEWLAGVLLDSCHTVWFELHTALLDRLGFSREEEETRLGGDGR
ncbi:hypothetical protein [Actinomadura rubrisoli]|uniref:Uncharacterized protein n=1 Tax=Actinomadura rubrisoli TaxID=2530368 RepID=A0A4R5BHI9_9ACTN|nr:hypothetical protein [Actinomadura rubrisoli]TDD84486.1 hypothetical protein E1298_19910 [Actinomadura rubrisoli]